MKCHKPNTDQDCDFRILVNGRSCTEYVLPTARALTDRNTTECFVPVSAEDRLTLSGSFSGSLWNASFDLLVDGSFADEKRIGNTKTTDIFHAKSNVKFATVHEKPWALGDTSNMRDADLAEGHLEVELLPADRATLPSNEFVGVDAFTSGVGTLAVVVSLNQSSDDTYAHEYTSKLRAEWGQHKETIAQDGAISPTHILVVRPKEKDMSSKKLKEHRRQLKSRARPGRKAWATLLFHYRSQEAIEAAGCVRRAEDSHALERGDAASFVRASQEKKASDTNPKGAGENEAIATAQRLSRDSTGLFLTPAAEGPESENTVLSSKYFPQTSTSQGSKQRLFGRTLLDSLFSSATTTAKVQPLPPAETANGALLQTFNAERHHVIVPFHTFKHGPLFEDESAEGNISANLSHERSADANADSVAGFDQGLHRQHTVPTATMDARYIHMREQSGSRPSEPADHERTSALPPSGVGVHRESMTVETPAELLHTEQRVGENSEDAMATIKHEVDSPHINPLFEQLERAHLHSPLGVMSSSAHSGATELWNYGSGGIGGAENTRREILHDERYIQLVTKDINAAATDAEIEGKETSVSSLFTGRNVITTSVEAHKGPPPESTTQRQTATPDMAETSAFSSLGQHIPFHRKRTASTLSDHFREPTFGKKLRGDALVAKSSEVLRKKEARKKWKEMVASEKAKLTEVTREREAEELAADQAERALENAVFRSEAQLGAADGGLIERDDEDFDAESHAWKIEEEVKKMRAAREKKSKCMELLAQVSGL